MSDHVFKASPKGVSIATLHIQKIKSSKLKMVGWMLLRRQKQTRIAQVRGENNKAFPIDFSTNQSLCRIVNNNSKEKEGPGSVGEMLPCHFVFSGFWNRGPANLCSFHEGPLVNVEKLRVIVVYTKGPWLRGNWLKQRSAETCSQNTDAARRC